MVESWVADVVLVSSSWVPACKTAISSLWKGRVSNHSKCSAVPLCEPCLHLLIFALCATWPDLPEVVKLGRFACSLRLQFLSSSVVRHLGSLGLPLTVSAPKVVVQHNNAGSSSC